MFQLLYDSNQQMKTTIFRNTSQMLNLIKNLDIFQIFLNFDLIFYVYQLLILHLEVISLCSTKMITQVSSSLIKIYVRLHNGNGCPLTVQPAIHFYQLIRIINRMQLQLPQQYTIVFRGKHIKNYDLTLSQLGISQNSILHIEEAIDRSPKSMNMDVCVCYNQQNFIVKSAPTDTVLALKHIIFKLTKVSPKHQILVFNGNKLDNQYTLQSYRICPNSLICLISTAKMPELSEVHSEYDQVINNFLQTQNTLLDSVISLCEKKQSTKISLFRSDSINRKSLLLCSPIQVEIKQKSINDDNDSECEGKDFNFDLFKSFGMSNPMTLSIGYNLFDSLKHPLKIHPFVMKDDELMKENNFISEDIQAELVSSTKSFRI